MLVSSYNTLLLLLRNFYPVYDIVELQCISICNTAIAALWIITFEILNLGIFMNFVYTVFAELFICFNVNFFRPLV